jgi:hypothetical protein
MPGLTAPGQPVVLGEHRVEIAAHHHDVGARSLHMIVEFEELLSAYCGVGAEVNGNSKERERRRGTPQQDRDRAVEGGDVVGIRPSIAGKGVAGHHDGCSASEVSIRAVLCMAPPPLAPRQKRLGGGQSQFLQKHKVWREKANETRQFGAASGPEAIGIPREYRNGARV